MPPTATTPPAWLEDATLCHLRMTREHCRARGHDEQATIAAIRDALWGRHPALPLTAIDDAAHCIASASHTTDRQSRRHRPEPSGHGGAARSRLFLTRAARIAMRFRSP